MGIVIVLPGDVPAGGSLLRVLGLGDFVLVGSVEEIVGEAGDDVARLVCSLVSLFIGSIVRFFVSQSVSLLDTIHVVLLLLLMMMMIKKHDDVKQVVVKQYRTNGTTISRDSLGFRHG